MEIFRQITANNILLKEYPFRKELSMEAYLLENEDILKLDDKNFSDVAVLDAEIALKQGRRTGDGRIDILAKYGDEALGIVEIKLHEINSSSLYQLHEYLDQKNQLLSLGDYWTNSFDPKWVGILIGTSISRELQDKLSNGYDYNGTPIAGIVIRRFKSDRNEIFVVSDSYFKYKYSTKDYSKFIFNDQQLNKGKLVNAVLKYYVESNPLTSFSELKTIFPDKVQGSRLGVFEEKNKADDIYQRWGHKRYYIKPEELITLTDSTIATCNQWDPNNIKRFIERSNSMGIKIEIA